jgi:hypothetical protein
MVQQTHHESRVRIDRMRSDLMSLEEYAARTGEGLTKVRENARLDRLLCPVLRSGRRYFISRLAFEALLARQHNPARQDAVA